MKKLTIQDIPAIMESDKDLLFDYFTQMRAAKCRAKMAFGFAAIGCFTLAMVYFSGLIISKTDGIPDYFNSVQMFMELTLPIVSIFPVIGNLYLARTLRRDAENNKNELTVRGFDVSGLTCDQIFDHDAYIVRIHPVQRKKAAAQQS